MFTTNPTNGRKLKVGGATYNKLVAAGTIVVAPEPRAVNQDDVVDDDENKESNDTKRLIELSSLQATKLYRNISSGKLEIPANIDTDEELSNYLQQSLMLGLLQEKDELIKKMGQPKSKAKKGKAKKVKFVSSSDSESSE
jgi:hypothetical protein